MKVPKFQSGISSDASRKEMNLVHISLSVARSAVPTHAQVVDIGTEFLSIRLAPHFRRSLMPPLILIAKRIHN
jgi:hypothetical protein